MNKMINWEHYFGDMLSKELKIYKVTDHSTNTVQEVATINYNNNTGMFESTLFNDTCFEYFIDCVAKSIFDLENIATVGFSITKVIQNFICNILNKLDIEESDSSGMVIRYISNIIYTNDNGYNWQGNIKYKYYLHIDEDSKVLQDNYDNVMKNYNYLRIDCNNNKDYDNNIFIRLNTEDPVKMCSAFSLVNKINYLSDDEEIIDRKNEVFFKKYDISPVDVAETSLMIDNHLIINGPVYTFATDFLGNDKFYDKINKITVKGDSDIQDTNFIFNADIKLSLNGNVPIFIVESNKDAYSILKNTGYRNYKSILFIADGLEDTIMKYKLSIYRKLYLQYYNNILRYSFDNLYIEFLRDNPYLLSSIFYTNSKNFEKIKSIPNYKRYIVGNEYLINKLLP